MTSSSDDTLSHVRPKFRPNTPTPPPKARPAIPTVGARASGDEHPRVPERAVKVDEAGAGPHHGPGGIGVHLHTGRAGHVDHQAPARRVGPVAVASGADGKVEGGAAGEIDAPLDIGGGLAIGDGGRGDVVEARVVEELVEGVAGLARKDDGSRQRRRQRRPLRRAPLGHRGRGRRPRRRLPPCARRQGAGHGPRRQCQAAVARQPEEATPAHLPRPRRHADMMALREGAGRRKVLGLPAFHRGAVTE